MICTIENKAAFDALCSANPSVDAFFDTHSALRERLQKEWHNASETCRFLGFAAFEGAQLRGFFVFRLYTDDRMLEMHKWLPLSEAASREMLDHLKNQFASWQAEFTLCPSEYGLCPLLSEYGATVYPEQQNMILTRPPSDVNTDGVELLSEPYRDAYFALHKADPDTAYWSGEAVAADPDTFRVFLMRKGGRVLGYLDVTHCYETNNISDLYVDETARRTGYGTKLLAKVIEMNRPKGLTLQVDLDNTPAIRLYEKMGFEPIPDRNTIDAIWKL